MRDVSSQDTQSQQMQGQKWDRAPPGTLILPKGTRCKHLSPQTLVRSGHTAGWGEPKLGQLTSAGLLMGDTVNSGARQPLPPVLNSALCVALGKSPVSLSIHFLLQNGGSKTFLAVSWSASRQSCSKAHIWQTSGSGPVTWSQLMGEQGLVLV